MAKAITIACINSGQGASPYYRMYPYSMIGDAEISFSFSDKLGAAWKEDGTLVDAVILQRPIDPLALQFIKEYKMAGGMVIVDTDDDIPNIPFTNPAHSEARGMATKIYEECLKEAHYVTCSTPELKRSDKYIVFPNTIDFRRYAHPVPIQERKIKMRESFCAQNGIPLDAKIIMFAGSPTHQDSILLIKDVITELAKDEKVKVVIASNKEWAQQFNFENVIVTGWMPFDHSHNIYAMADINLAPLPKNRFNECKSELRILESAVWKVPTVCSSVAPYKRFAEISSGGAILVRKEKKTHWMDAINSLLQDNSLYLSTSEKAYQAVANFYNMDFVNKHRAAWLKHILKVVEA